MLSAAHVLNSAWEKTSLSCFSHHEQPSSWIVAKTMHPRSFASAIASAYVRANRSGGASVAGFLGALSGSGFPLASGEARSTSPATASARSENGNGRMLMGVQPAGRGTGRHLYRSRKAPPALVPHVRPRGRWV